VTPRRPRTTTIERLASSRPALGNGKAAVDVKLGAADVGGFVGREERDRNRDFLDAARRHREDLR
jgi:hypothetical protein